MHPLQKAQHRWLPKQTEYNICCGFFALDSILSWRTMINELWVAPNQLSMLLISTTFCISWAARLALYKQTNIKHKAVLIFTPFITQNVQLTLSQQGPWKSSGRWSTWRADYHYHNQFHTDVDHCLPHHTSLPASPVPTATQTCSQNGHARTYSCLFTIREPHISSTHFDAVHYLGPLQT